jgi:hypothetical protein
MGNMTYMFWQPGQQRRGNVYPPLAPGDDGYAAPCVLCSRQLGGKGRASVPVQEFAVGPARGDVEAEKRHAQGLVYNCAAIVVHQPCLAQRKDPDLELIAPELEMVPRADRPAPWMVLA